MKNNNIIMWINYVKINIFKIIYILESIYIIILTNKQCLY